MLKSKHKVQQNKRIINSSSVKWAPGAITARCCYSHRSLDEPPLLCSLLPGVQEAASDGQSGAGLQRAELNDGEGERGQRRRAEEDEEEEEEDHSVFMCSTFPAIFTANTIQPLCFWRWSVDLLGVTQLRLGGSFRLQLNVGMNGESLRSRAGSARFLATDRSSTCNKLQLGFQNEWTITTEYKNHTEKKNLR